MGFTPIDKMKPSTGSGFTPVTPGKQGMTHYNDPTFLERARAELGVTKLGKSDLPFVPRTALSLSETDPEIKTAFQKFYPKGDIKRVENPRGQSLFYHYGDENWAQVDEPGASIGDIADLAGYAPEILGGVAGTLAAPGSPIAMGAVGTAAGHLVEEGIESLLGTQGQGPADIALDTAKEGLFDYAAGKGLAGMVGKPVDVLTGRGGIDMDDALRSDVRLMEQARQQGYPAAMPHQYAPTHAVISRTSKQTTMGSGAAQELYEAQRRAPRGKLMEMMDRTPYAAGKRVQQGADEALRREIDGFLGRSVGIQPEKAGKAAYGAFTKWDKESKTAMKNAWGRVDDAAAQENPIFDLTGAQATARRVENMVPGVAAEQKEIVSAILDAKGDALITKIDDYINVADTPNGQLSRVSSLLQKLSPEQTNYEVVKQLRTRVGGILDNTPWNNDINQSAGRMMYGALTDTLKSPDSPRFTAALGNAIDKSRYRYDRLAKRQVRNIFRKGVNEDFYQLGSQLAQPGGMNAPVRELIRGANPDQKQVIADMAASNILKDPGGAAAAIQRWNDTDKAGLNTLFGPGAEKALKGAAASIDHFNNTVTAQIAKGVDTVSPVDVASRHLASEGMDVKQARMLVKQMGGKGSDNHLALRAAVIQDIMDKALKPGKTGLELSTGSLQNALAAYKKRGVYQEILTAEDRTALKLADVYARRVLGGTADVGANLELQAAISQLKKPSTFLSGAHEIGMNKIIASVMMSSGFRKAVIGSGKKPLNRQPFSLAGHIANAYISSPYNTDVNDPN